MSLMRRIQQWLTPQKSRVPADELASAFQARYQRFKELLASNAELARIIGDIEEKLAGYQIYGTTYVRSQASRSIFHTRRMIECLNALSGQKYRKLSEVMDDLEVRIQAEIGLPRERLGADWILPFSRITREVVDWVGSKNANLGDVRNRVHLPIPAGFAVTTTAYQHFLKHNALTAVIRDKLDQDLVDAELVNGLSQEIQTLITEAPLPPDLEAAILEAYDGLVAQIRQTAPHYRGEISVRSSAVGEDTELSYAGQYLTILNVRRDDLLSAYRRVIASLYSPWAISYRLHNGVRDEDLAMSVACLQMVEPVTSGVAFSRHPFSQAEDVAIISAVWGLGPTAVDGNITPDMYTVSRDDREILQVQVSSKPIQLVGSEDGTLVEAELPEEMQNAGCLSPEKAQMLAGYAIDLEQHYGSAQDVEWAIDHGGRVFILQSRPLRLDRLKRRGSSTHTMQPGPNPLLIEGGAVASPGVGCGPVHHVTCDEDLKTFPDGGVLVARHPSPRNVLVMAKAQAIVTDSGSPLGHMASLCREFNVPTLLDTKVATSLLEPGMVVTVDAELGRVYGGRVSELLEQRGNSTPYMKGTPVSQLLERVAELIVPLRLINPRSPTFTPGGCRSLHDIMRFVHESSYAAMFQISDLLSERDGGAVKLLAPVPLDLYVIDLGGGLTAQKGPRRRTTVDEVQSMPFQALLKGMLHEELRVRRPGPIEVSGFFSVMSEQLLTPPGYGGERFGARSYAIISDSYLHFSSRIGYHYSIVDSYCDDMTRKSYITFSFEGGAADEVRRGRRARAVAIIMKSHGFSVDTKADRVVSRLKRGDRPTLLEKLEMIGRLLQFTRQLDMLMASEESVNLIAQAFLEGKYHLEVKGIRPS